MISKINIFLIVVFQILVQTQYSVAHSHAEEIETYKRLLQERREQEELLQNSLQTPIIPDKINQEDVDLTYTVQDSDIYNSLDDEDFEEETSANQAESRNRTRSTYRTQEELLESQANGTLNLKSRSSYRGGRSSYSYSGGYYGGYYRSYGGYYGYGGYGGSSVIIVGYYSPTYGYYNSYDNLCSNMTCEFCCVDGKCQTDEYCKEIAPSALAGFIFFVIMIACAVAVVQPLQMHQMLTTKMGIYSMANVVSLSSSHSSHPKSIHHINRNKENIQIIIKMISKINIFLIVVFQILVQTQYSVAHSHAEEIETYKRLLQERREQEELLQNSLQTPIIPDKINQEDVDLTYTVQDSDIYNSLDDEDFEEETSANQAESRNRTRSTYRTQEELLESQANGTLNLKSRSSYRGGRSSYSYSGGYYGGYYRSYGGYYGYGGYGGSSVIIVGYYSPTYGYYNSYDNLCSNMTCEFCCVDGKCQTDEYCKEIAPSALAGFIFFVIMIACCCCCCVAIARCIRNANHKDEHFFDGNRSFHSHSSHSSHHNHHHVQFQDPNALQQPQNQPPVFYNAPPQGGYPGMMPPTGVYDINQQPAYQQPLLGPDGQPLPPQVYPHMQGGYPQMQGGYPAAPNYYDPSQMQQQQQYPPVDGTQQTADVTQERNYSFYDPATQQHTQQPNGQQ
eukprot:403373500